MQTNNAMMYVINNENNELKQELQRLNADNEQLRRKLSAKNSECEKLKREVKEAKMEFEQYKLILKQFNDTLGVAGVAAGAQPGQAGGSKGKRWRAPASHCCCHGGGGAGEKPFTCDWQNCGKRFRQKSHLDAHRNKHTERRFACDWPACGKSFMRKYNLLEHRKLHSTVNPNVCAACGKFFSSKYSLVRHQNAQHGAGVGDGNGAVDAVVARQ